MEDSKKYNSLMIRYLEGNLLGHEYEELTELLKDPRWLKLFDHMKNHWEPDISSSAQTNRNWLRIKSSLSRIQKLESSFVSNRRLFVRRIASIAAILFLGILLGAVVQNIFIQNLDQINHHVVFETPRGERSKITLPDGTEVFLNAKSRLEYNGFADNERKVSFIGEGFFKVAHNEKKPFIVKTLKGEVKVLGTEFNVMAYEDFGRDEIALVTGRVRVTSGKNEVLLVPGEMAVLQNGSIQIQEINANQVIGWVNNRFNFSDIPLEELMMRLENWYDVDIDLYNPGKKRVTFSGTFKNEETIWQVLDVIKVYLPIKYDRISLRKIKIVVE